MMAFLNNLFGPLLGSSAMAFISKLNIDEGNLMSSIAIAMTAVSLCESYLAFRQRKVLAQEGEVPPELKNDMDKEKFEKSRQYALDKNMFGLVQAQFDLIINISTLMLKMHVLLWISSELILNKIGLPIDKYEINQTYVFVVLSSIVEVVLNTPFKLYSTFVIEEKHGFNNQTLGFFVKDEIKKFFLSQVITFPILSGIIFIIKAGGPYFAFYAWGFTTVVILVMMTIYPVYIAPLFDKYTSLPEGELRTEIEALAKKLDYPLTKLFVVEGSKRSAHSNAYLYGFFKNKRIVLFDTLIKGYKSADATEEDKKNGDDKDITAEEKKKLEEKQNAKKDRGCTTEEIVAVLGHELGHWKYSHMVKMLIITEVKILLFFILFSKVLNSKSLYRAFGFSKSQPAVIGLTVILGNILTPCKVVINLLMGCLSRHFEYQADYFATTLGYSKELGASLIKLHVDNLSFPFNDRWYSLYHFSHPTLIERLRTIAQYKTKKTD
ncbi:CAAX prenyl protease 1 homolog [Thrips palmi]|uniref:CAAX prenyl protease n=1 Tax=Thrips palmi TaxID=161013 RepID=A0A6P8ZIF9_THRPL|nr:CAAX prenyl protease 1 homolog [Thrips palmi]XP_034233533.1 CAAX prenyl protease 1 homolog [Thrips palmi]XP_034233534.1 CAAX prenyl protease 1 homolog [Thrips palmi]XP_034233535.1 CAAX prenyl protease 1 homolog [Thrips palmi]